MHATASVSLRMKLTAARRTGSHGDHVSFEESWNNNIASDHGLSSRETEQILHYYYQSAEDAEENSSSGSNDEVDDLSTTALQGHQGTSSTNITTNSGSSFNRRSVDSSFSSSSGTISAPVQRAGLIMMATATSSNFNNISLTADKRRGAIIEMDPSQSPKSHFNTKTAEHATLLARRGALNINGDAVCMPSLTLLSSHVENAQSTPKQQPVPDAVPPLSAPAIHSAFPIPDHSNAGHHQRSMSDAQSKHRRGKSSRDIGIVGTIGTTPLSPSNQAPEAADPEDAARLTLPLFQTPRSRSPSPSSFSALITPVDTARPPSRLHGNRRSDEKMTDSEVEENSAKSTSHLKHPSLDTPRHSVERERDKQRHSARLAFKPAQPPPLSYLYYQPGLHSTAGPLPSPPRRIYNLTPSNSNPPLRPPRLTPQSRPASSERRQSQDSLSPRPLSSQLQLTSTPSGSSDYSLIAVSVASENEQVPQASIMSDEQSITLPSQTESTSTDGDTESFYTSNHVREGAFGISIVEQPSKVSSETELKDVQDDKSTEHKLESLSISNPNQPSLPDTIQPKRKGSPTSSHSITSDPLVTSPPSPPSSYGSTDEAQAKLPPLPIWFQKRTSRRTSLPLPPLVPEPVVDTFYQPVVPRIAVDAFPKDDDIKKPPSAWPNAMNFQEILTMQSSKERALAYSAKFRELMLEETGLRNWLNSVAKKDRYERNNLGVSSVPTNRPSHKQLRHISRGSIASEATFPIRQDAYTATDLMSKPITELPSPMTAPPTLPYPSLAQGIGVRKRSSKNLSLESPLVSPVGSTKSLGGGFFASIGRKASLRRERTLQPVSPNKQAATLLQAPKNNSQPPPSRVIKLAHAPTLPGGPRAPPRSVHRSSTLLPPRRTEDSSSSLKRHSISPARRSTESNGSFDRHLDMMADLLPQAGRAVLSAYLRRAQNNDPMAAITDYLEDAKHGDVRVP